MNCSSTFFIFRVLKSYFVDVKLMNCTLLFVSSHDILKRTPLIGGMRYMKLSIGQPIVEPDFSNCFEIVVNMMHGDNTSSATDSILIPKDREWLVENVIETLEAMKALPSGKARKLYKTIPGFLFWFDEDYPGNDEDAMWTERYTFELQEEIQDYSFVWHRDAVYYEYYAALKDYDVYFYDEHGIKRYVEINPSK